MRTNLLKQKTSAIFWLLLLYVIAALIWWFISLERQNKEMRAYRMNHLETTVSKQKTPQLYDAESEKIDVAYRRTTFKYAGEGIVFLGLILIGAVFVFRSLKRQQLLQKQQQHFMMAVTHELKTPIAVSKLNLETLLKHQLDEARREKLIQASLEETKRLDFLTSNILVSSQLESSGYKKNHEEMDLSDLLHDRVREFRTRYPDRTFIEEIEEDNDIVGDPFLLQILINNLLENAVKYSDKDSPITVSSLESGGAVIMQVIDEGVGIPETEKKNIFEKFYRIGNESTRKKQGTGLGLYLCKKIAKDHNADISMTNHTPHGSIFAVTFYSS